MQAEVVGLLAVSVDEQLLTTESAESEGISNMLRRDPWLEDGPLA
jgi:hypothetical protein